MTEKKDTEWRLRMAREELTARDLHHLCEAGAWSGLPLPAGSESEAQAQAKELDRAAK